MKFQVRNSRQHLRMLAFAASLGLVTEAGFSQNPGEVSTPLPSQKDEKAEKIQVTGSRIKRLDFEGASPLTVYDRKEISGSGYGTVADFLQNRGGIYASNTITENFTLSQIRGSQAFEGRALASSYTLVLLNGRRLPTNAIAADFVDINQIPLAAVDRIEYLPDGGSAIYGSDAVAGVLNIITRKEYNGVSAKYRYGANEKGQGIEENYELVAGVSTENANFIIAYDAFRREAIAGVDRPFTDSAVAPDGSADDSSPTGLPGSYVDSEGPKPADNCPEDRIVPFGGGEVCSYDYGPLYQATPSSDRQSIYTVFDYKLADKWGPFMEPTLFGEFRFSRAHTISANGASPGSVLVPHDSPILQSQSNYVDEPARNADGDLIGPDGKVLVDDDGNQITDPEQGYYPDRLIIRRYVDYGPRLVDNYNETFSSIAGIRGEIGEHEISFTYLRTYLRNLQVSAGGQIYGDNAIKAIQDGNLDPFIENKYEAQDVADSVDVNTLREGTTQLDTWQVSGTGDLPVALAGGNIGYALGMEWREEEFQDKSDYLSSSDKILGSAGSDGAGDRSNRAIFAEMLLPIIDMLDLQLAGRFDDIGSATANTYKIGLKLQPITALVFRASYGTGFKAPDLHELYLGTSFGVQDAKDIYGPDCNGDANACEEIEISSRSSGNPDLDPEKSKNYNVGVAWDSFGFYGSVDYWNIEVKDRVGEYGVEYILANAPQFPDLIFRDANGDVSSISQGYVLNRLENISQHNVTGVDFKFNYQLNLPEMGTFLFRASVDKILKDEYPEGPGEPLCDRAGDQRTPNSKFALNWAHNNISVLNNFRYNGSYDSYDGSFTKGTCDRANPDSKHTVEAKTMWDLQVGYFFPTNTAVALGVQNLTDQDPAFDRNEGYPFYKKGTYDNRGRFIYAQLSQEF